MNKKPRRAKTKGGKTGAPEGAESEAPYQEPEKPIVIVPPKEVRFTKVVDHPLISQIMASYVEDWKRDHSGDKRARLYFYVSDAGRCARQLVYQFIAPEIKHDMNAGTISMFRMGDLFHQEIQDRLRRIGATTAKDIEFGTFGGFPHETRGRIDVLLPEGDVVVISDIKSKNPFGFKDEPGIEEVLQLSIYIYQSKRDKYFEARHKKIADYGYLIYVDRGGLGDPPFIVWRVEYDETLVEAARDWFTKIHERIESKIVPERPFTRDSVPCSYCRFQSYCWADVPVPVIPEPTKDEAIVPPTQEIVESMAAMFLNGKAKMGEFKKEVALAEGVLIQYFKATGNKEIAVGAAKIKYEGYDDTSIDLEYLLRHVRGIWPLIAKPTMALLEAAVKQGIMSGTTYEAAIKHEPAFRLKIDKPKSKKE